jgi:hypothetical protein
MFLNNYRRITDGIFRGIYRRNEEGNFFYASVPLVNPSVIIFFYYQRIYRQTKITDERFTDGAFPSMISLVN